MKNKYLIYDNVEISIPKEYQDKICYISKNNDGGYYISLNYGYEMRHYEDSQYYGSDFDFDSKKELLNMLKTIRKCKHKDFWDKGYHNIWLKKYNNKSYLDTAIGFKENEKTWKVLIMGLFHDIPNDDIEIIGE